MLSVDKFVGSISIHAPRAGSDCVEVVPVKFLDIFQSTLPVRGATNSYWCTNSYLHISIHAPRAGSDRKSGMDSSEAMKISIHAPRAGSDEVKRSVRAGDIKFQSTLPVRGATIETMPSAYKAF